MGGCDSGEEINMINDICYKFRLDLICICDLVLNLG